MVVLRYIFSLLLAIGLVFGIFWTLQSMINLDSKKKFEDDKVQFVDFVRLKKDQELIKKQRVKPKKPKPKKQPPKPKIDIKKEVKVVKQKINMEKLDLKLPLNLTANSALGDARVNTGSGSISTNVIPISKVNPIYPRRAKRLKKEGYVKLEFTITKMGTVKDVVIRESNPEKIFDAAAKRALLKWKFKPKLDEGKAVEQRAILQIDFRLDQ